MLSPGEACDPTEGVEKRHMRVSQASRGTILVYLRDRPAATPALASDFLAGVKTAEADLASIWLGPRFARARMTPFPGGRAGAEEEDVSRARCCRVVGEHTRRGRRSG